MPSSGIILAAEIILIGFVIAAIAYEGNFTRYTWWSFSVGYEAIRFVPAAWPCPLFGSDLLHSYFIVNSCDWKLSRHLRFFSHVSHVLVISSQP